MGFVWATTVTKDQLFITKLATTQPTPQASDSPFVVNPCHDVTESWSPGSCGSSTRGEQRQLRIYHSNLMRTTADFPPPDGRGNSLPASPFCSGSSSAGASFTFPVMSETTSSSCRGSTAAPAGASPPRRLSGTLPANHRSYRRLDTKELVFWPTYLIILIQYLYFGPIVDLMADF